MQTVLIADDDSVLLDLVAALLEPVYTVVTAKDGYEAIRVLADRHIDLLIADLRMPGLDGKQLVTQAKVMRPSLRVIFLTGFAAETERVTADRVLQKPIRGGELLKHVREELARA